MEEREVKKKKERGKEIRKANKKKEKGKQREESANFFEFYVFPFPSSFSIKSVNA